MRSTTTEITNAIVQPVVYSLGLVRLDFDGGTLAWNSGFSSIVYGGKTYLAAGTLTSITNAAEESGVKSSSISITLSCVKSEVVSALLSEPYLGRKAYVYQAFVAEDMVFNPLMVKLIFVGSMDNISCKIGKSSTFTVSIRSRLADWERSRNIKYTDIDQQKLHPGDKFMQFIPQISKKKIIWPRAAALLDPRD